MAMRRSVLFAMLVLAISGFFTATVAIDTTSAAQRGGPAGKVKICHVTDDPANPYAYIEVSQNAVAAHEAHGDIVNVSSATDCPGPQEPVTCGYLAGIVTDADSGAGISGVMVSIAGFTTTTGSDGSYAFTECIEQGEYEVSFSAGGFYGTTLLVTIVADTTTTLNAVLEPIPTCGYLSGTITDLDTGLGIEGATVNAGEFAAVTASDGTYAFAECFAPGDLAVSASAVGYTDGSTTVTIVAGETAIADITLEPVPAPTCGYVSGTITDLDTGLGIEGATVTTGTLSTTTDADGNYAFAECVEEGEITVSASADGYTSNAATVTVVAGSTVTADVVLAPVAPVCGSISGVISDSSSGIPISGASVEVDGQTTTTDASGAFSFPCLDPGTYTVTANASGYAEGSQGNVEVISGADTDVNIALVPAVSCEDGVNGAITIVLTWNSESASVPSDLDSHLATPDGAHVAYFSPNPVSYASLDVDDTTWAGPETITIDPTDPAFVGGTYHYWVHNYSRTPEFSGSGAVVTISQCNQQLAQYAVSGATGDDSLDLWDVVLLDIDADGNVTLTPVMDFKAGDSRSIP